MEIDKATQIIRFLADGRDQATGQVFPPDSPAVAQSVKGYAQTKGTDQSDPTQPQVHAAQTHE